MNTYKKFLLVQSCAFANQENIIFILPGIIIQ
jgi:hypothetical protein